MSAEDAARRVRALADLHDHVGYLNGDEVAVLAQIARRVREGRLVYGPLSLAADDRDFDRETAEELLDALMYRACRWLLRGPAHSGQ